MTRTTDHPGTLECDRCHRAWITHPAWIKGHPHRTHIHPNNVTAYAVQHGWTTTTTGDICPRCTDRRASWN